MHMGEGGWEGGRGCQWVDARPTVNPHAGQSAHPLTQNCSCHKDPAQKQMAMALDGMTVVVEPEGSLHIIPALRQKSSVKALAKPLLRTSLNT